LRLFEQGLHYVGDWHTHPEPIPHPSATDTAEILDIFRCSKHELAAMLLVIVGQSTFPKGLFVGAVHGYGVQSLHPDAPRVTA
jgi:integrative and conjugative element protein (TIGR02256 family)